MDDITKKYEFQLILQDAAKYRMIRDIIDDDHRTRLPERRFEKAGLSPDKLAQRQRRLTFLTLSFI